MFRSLTSGPNQMHVRRSDVIVTGNDLLRMPPGGVTAAGLKHNIEVGVYFIVAWLKGSIRVSLTLLNDLNRYQSTFNSVFFVGKGHFFFKNAVEDSATAEISRSQVSCCKLLFSIRI